MKKRIAVIFAVLTLIAVLAVTFLVGCGDPTDTPAESTPSETPVETPKETEPKHEHSFGEWTEIKAPTCTEKGQKERACECGEKETEETEASGHSYESVVTEPTCTEKGYTTHTCTVCSDSYKDSETDAKGHSYTDVVTAPTCTEKGYTTHTCTVCSDSYKDSETDAKGHSYTDIVTAPTCTEKGYTTHTCSVCSDSYKDSETSAKGHSYTDVVTAPTCTEKGYTTHTCSACGDSYKDSETDAKGHSYTSVVTPPTETEKGYTTYTCSCGDTYKDNYVDPIPPAPVHAFGEWKEIKAPSCSEAGQKERVCDCGEKETEEIPKTEHKYTKYLKRPTCTEQGYTTYVCNCGSRYMGDYTPAKGHSYTSSVTPPTTAGMGYTTHTCINCGYSYKDSFTDAIHTHSFGEWQETKAPTCTDKGQKERACGCGEKETENIPAKGHTEVTDAAVAPTCTATGLTEGKHCSVCNTVTAAQNIVPAKGHSYDDVYDETCNVCGAVRDAECAHTETTTINGTPATCTAGGLTDGKKCAKCGAVVEAQQMIPAKGHTEETIPAKAATCTEPGLTEGKRCSVCTTVIIAQQTVSAKGHSEETVPAKAATCTEPGLTEGKHCSVCGTVLAAQTQVPAKGHEEYVANAVAAETWKTGLKTYKCRNCTAHSREEVIPKVEGEMVYYEDFNGLSSSLTSTQIFQVLGWKNLYKNGRELPAGSDLGTSKAGAQSISAISLSVNNGQLILDNASGRSFIQILSTEYMSVAAKGDYTVQIDMTLTETADGAWASIAPRYKSSTGSDSNYASWRLTKTGFGFHEAQHPDTLLRCGRKTSGSSSNFPSADLNRNASNGFWVTRIPEYQSCISSSNTTGSYDGGSDITGKKITILVQVVRSDSSYRYAPTAAELGDTSKMTDKYGDFTLSYGYHIWIVSQGQRYLVGAYNPDGDYSGTKVCGASYWDGFGDTLAFAINGKATVAIDNLAVWTGLGDMPEDKNFSDYETKLNPYIAAIPSDTSESGIVISKNREAKLYMVIPENADRNVLYARDKFKFYVEEKMGVTLPSGTQSGNAYELLIGDTGRAESKTLKATLSGNQYAIKRDGNKIIIVATNDAFLYDAVEYFIANGLSSSVSGNKMVYTGNIDYKGTGDTTSVRYLFTKSSTISSTSSVIATMTAPDSSHTANQGGCTDGKYYYQAFIARDNASEEANNTARIVKTDLATGQRVMVSEKFSAGHTNDITYNTRTNQLVVANNKPYYTTLTILDATTLKFVKNVTIPNPIYSVTYSPERDIYFVGCSNSNNVRGITADFKLLDQNIHIADPSTWGFTTQGIGSDDTFVYTVLYKSSGNVIAVFDWYGNYVGTIKITLKSGSSTLESESIDVDENGRILVVASKRIWHVTPTA